MSEDASNTESTTNPAARDAPERLSLATRQAAYLISELCRDAVCSIPHASILAGLLGLAAAFANLLKAVSPTSDCAQSFAETMRAITNGAATLYVAFRVFRSSRRHQSRAPRSDSVSQLSQE